MKETYSNGRTYHLDHSNYYFKKNLTMSKMYSLVIYIFWRHAEILKPLFYKMPLETITQADNSKLKFFGEMYAAYCLTFYLPS